MDEFENKLYVRSSAADGTSFGGFRWPREVGAIAEAFDYRDNDRCGRGLHMLDERGTSRLLRWEHDAVWFLVRPERVSTRHLDEGKIKTRKAIVEAVGTHAHVMCVARDEGCFDLVPADPFGRPRCDDPATDTLRNLWRECVKLGPASQDLAASVVQVGPGIYPYPSVTMLYVLQEIALGCLKFTFTDSHKVFEACSDSFEKTKLGLRTDAFPQVVEAVFMTVSGHRRVGYRPYPQYHGV